MLKRLHEGHGKGQLYHVCRKLCLIDEDVSAQIFEGNKLRLHQRQNSDCKTKALPSGKKKTAPMPQG